MTTNSTKYLEAAALRRALEDACHAAGVDLDGCTTAAEMRAAIQAQCPALLSDVLPGHGSQDPTIERWLDERGDDLSWPPEEVSDVPREWVEVQS